VKCEVVYLDGRCWELRAKVSSHDMRHEVKNRTQDLDAPLVTVTGLVIPVSWDGDGNPCSTSIHSAGEIEYFVEQDQKGKELLRLATKEVEITGVLTRTINDQRQISVTHYRLLKNMD
jgi:hypothetical protein